MAHILEIDMMMYLCFCIVMIAGVFIAVPIESKQRERRLVEVCDL